MRAICEHELAPLGEETWTDGAGNLVGLVRGSGDPAGRPRVRVVAHMDELAMIVKRVGDKATWPSRPRGYVPGQLWPRARHCPRRPRRGDRCPGPRFGDTTQQTPRVWQTKPDRGGRALDWLHVYVFTGRSPDELQDAGFHPGTGICIGVPSAGS